MADRSLYEILEHVYGFTPKNSHYYRELGRPMSLGEIRQAAIDADYPGFDGNEIATAGRSKNKHIRLNKIRVDVTERLRRDISTYRSALCKYRVIRKRGEPSSDIEWEVFEGLQFAHNALYNGLAHLSRIDAMLGLRAAVKDPYMKGQLSLPIA